MEKIDPVLEKEQLIVTTISKDYNYSLLKTVLRNKNHGFYQNFHRCIDIHIDSQYPEEDCQDGRLMSGYAESLHEA